MSDVTITFDSNPFIKEVEKMTEAMSIFSKKVSTTTEENTSGAAKKTGKRITDTIKDTETKSKGAGKRLGDLTFSGLIGRIGVVSLALKGMHKVMAGMPEIGRTFSIAGGIIMRNFLWPLRKAVMPVLQSLLDWVRDHRAMFVRWGGILANIFKVVWQNVKMFVDLLKTFFNSFVQGVQRVTGTAGKSITDLINLALFKLAFLFQFIFISLQPIADLAGKVIATIIGWVKKFIDGFIIGMGDISGPLNDIWDTFNELLKTLGFIGDETDSVGKAFKVAGIIIGGGFKIALIAVAATIDGLIFGVKTLINVLRVLGNLLIGDFKKAKELGKEQDRLTAEYAKRQLERGKQVVGVLGETAGKAVTEVAGPGGGRIIPTVETSPAITSRTMNQENDIVINVNGAASPAATARAVNAGIKDTLKDQREKAGY